MNYIAISPNAFVILNETSNEAELIDKGFVLYTQADYDNYVAQIDVMTTSQTLEMLEQKSVEYIDFGMGLWELVKRKVWALNTYNKSQGINLTTEQMTALFSMSDMLEKSLKTGSLLTAIYICNNLSNSVPQYSSVTAYTIYELQVFMGIHS